METPSVRVLVVGDSGVGKTTLLQAICREPSAARDAGAAQPHRWTTGCDVHVLYYQYREGYGAEREVYVEFIDVGGHPKYEISRSMFYHDVQGVIFMHDLTNARSYDHLKAWSSELALYQRVKGCVVPSMSGAARPGEYPSLNALPKLIIGNKRDTVKANAKRPSALPELRNIESTESSADPCALDPTVFHNFLDRVVAFANSSSGDASSAFSHSSSTNATFMSPFSEGLRQMKSKPSASPMSLSGSAPLSGSGGAARGWWK